MIPMDIELYKKYWKYRIYQRIYSVLYNALVDISMFPTETVRYLIGPKYNVCNEKVKDIANKAINEWIRLGKIYDSVDEVEEIEKDFNLTEQEMKFFCDEVQRNYGTQKFESICNAIKEINNAKIHRFEDGLFDLVYRCYVDETIDVAKNCLERIKKYME